MPDCVLKSVPDAQLVGRGTLHYLIWDVYNALLYAPQGRQSADAPFALELDYKRSVDKQRIVNVTIDQMNDEGIADAASPESWRADMNRVFTSVQDGSVLTGIYQPDGPTCFFKDGRSTGCIDDPAFGKAFFAIWLSPKTTEPDLRRQLLGGPS